MTSGRDIDRVRRRHPDIPQAGLFDAAAHVDPAKAAERERARRSAQYHSDLPTVPRWSTIKRRPGRHCLDCLAEMHEGTRQYPERARARRQAPDGQVTEYCDEHAQPRKADDAAERGIRDMWG